MELLDGGRTLLWHAFPEKSFQNDIHSNNIKCEHTFDGGGDDDDEEKTEEGLRISSHCIHIKAGMYTHNDNDLLQKLHNNLLLSCSVR